MTLLRFPLRLRSLISSLLLVTAGAAALPAADSSPVWLPDLGNGSYRNPVINADYSDPDAIRVGDDYWMTASSFSHCPGLPILHSKDLVNWELVNHALLSLVPAEHFRKPRHGDGVWAPALRYHAGKFWIFYPDPDFGLYVITADDPRGKWSEPQMLKAGKGLIDPCPFWDEDGQAYLVHGWAKSRSGISNQLTLHRMNAEGTRLLDEGRVVIDANQMPGWRTLEGPKLYKRDGWYWIFAPAGGVAEGYQAAFRSRSIDGPYENRIVLEQGPTRINGPHQGAWVDTPSGEHWFLHFQEVPTLGRVVHLQPMRWREDGWPEMGEKIDANGKGQPVLTHAKPTLPSQPVAAPPVGDDFNRASLSLAWQWQANPSPEWFQLPQRGRLRLNCVERPASLNDWEAPALLMQKFPAPKFSASTALDLKASQPGDSAGLSVFGFSYARWELQRTEAGHDLVLTVHVDSNKNTGEKVLFRRSVDASRVILRVEVAEDRTCVFSYSLGGSTYVGVPAEFTATSSRWVGAKVGIFASRPPGTASGGHAEFDWFRIAP